MPLRRSAFVVAGSVALVATACDALLSIHTLDGGGGVPDASADGSTTLTLGSSACMACAAKSCANESTACEQEKDPAGCVPLENCLGSCEGGDPACRSKCTIDNELPSSGSAAVSALSACLVTNCENECGLQCGSFAANLSEPDAAGTCQSCFVQYGCDPSRACARSADCDAYWRCYRACQTPDCKFSCSSQHDAGAALFRQLQGVYSGSCMQDCAFGNYWACVGKISWPAAQSTQVVFTIPVVDIFGYAPMAGENVTVCASCPCGTSVAAPLGMATTDDAGIATVQVTQPLTSLHTGVSGCVQVISPTDASVPYYGYWGYPLSEPVVDPRQGPGAASINVAAQSVQVFTPDQLQLAAGAVDAGVVPGRGFVGAAVFDCFANPTPNARVSIKSVSGTDPLVSTFYPGSGGNGEATTTVGLGLLLDVPPGLYTVSAMPGPLDGGVSSIQSIVVGPGITTAVGMFPTPMP
jgi:hypothetical protein